MVQASGGTSFFGFWTRIVFDSHVKKNVYVNVLHENIHVRSLINIKKDIVLLEFIYIILFGTLCVWMYFF